MRHAAILLGFACLALTACEGRITDSEPMVPDPDEALRRNITQWGILPMGAMPPQDPSLVALGRALFFDRILSGNRDIACASCHQPGKSLGDGQSLAVGTGATGAGAERAPGPGRTFVPRHAPSLLNSGVGLFYVFWDGRLTRFGPGTFAHEGGPNLPSNLPNVLVAQGMLPVLNRREMRGEPGDTDVFGNVNELAQFGDDQQHDIWRAVMNRLLAIPEYAGMFRAAFPSTPEGSLTFEHAARALSVFQMEAFTKTGSPFDRFLGRDNAAMTVEQKRGATLFFGRALCSNCHSGPFLGGQSFANIGAPQVGPGGTREPPLDLGRGELDDSEFYRFAFRVAPLRNVELTAPYMHSGAYPTLEAVVDHYDDVPLALRTYDVSQLPAALRAQYHGDDATVNDILENLDFRLRIRLDLTDGEKSDLVAFLESLTDPAARNLSAITPERVPSGLPVDL